MNGYYWLLLVGASPLIKEIVQFLLLGGSSGLIQYCHDLTTVFPRIVAGASISKLIFLDQAFI